MPVNVDDEATARAFVAYYIHDVVSGAAEEGDPALIEAAAAERAEWEERGQLEGCTPQLVYIWALQNAARTGEDARDGRVKWDEFRRAKDDLDAVGRWLTAQGYVTHQPRAAG